MTFKNYAGMIIHDTFNKYKDMITHDTLKNIQV